MNNIFESLLAQAEHKTRTMKTRSPHIKTETQYLQALVKIDKLLAVVTTRKSAIAIKLLLLDKQVEKYEKKHYSI